MFKVVEVRADLITGVYISGPLASPEEVTIPMGLLTRAPGPFNSGLLIDDNLIDAPPAPEPEEPT